MARLNYKSYPFILRLARNLRNNQTSHEILVWNILRKKKLSGHKFLRQHPIFYSIRNDWVDFYIADFYCAKLKLIIEVDGKIHESQKEYDLERDSKLLEKGIYVFRIKNEEVSDPENTIKIINTIIDQRIKVLG
jgi:very-short-patch-repair endonuclease